MQSAGTFQWGAAGDIPVPVAQGCHCEAWAGGVRRRAVTEFTVIVFLEMTKSSVSVKPVISPLWGSRTPAAYGAPQLVNGYPCKVIQFAGDNMATFPFDRQSGRPRS